MSNFKKLYTAETLKKNKIVTVVCLPMEESIMFPVSQAIDLMKQGENVLYFSFTHDSIKINEFMQSALKNEVSPEKITGNFAVIDIHQIPEGMDWIKFVENVIKQVKGECQLNYTFFDIIEFVKNNKIRPGDEEFVVSTATLLAFEQKITPIIIKQVEPPITAIQNSEDARKQLDDFMSKDLLDSLNKSKALVEQSDYIIGVQREKNNFWKKLINFLLFWRKRSNFVLKVLKNRSGSYGQEYRMSIDMEEFKTEVL
jgi:hypothetical protein